MLKCNYFVKACILFEFSIFEHLFYVSCHWLYSMTCDPGLLLWWEVRAERAGNDRRKMVLKRADGQCAFS